MTKTAEISMIRMMCILTGGIILLNEDKGK